MGKKNFTAIAAGVILLIIGAYFLGYRAGTQKIIKDNKNAEVQYLKSLVDIAFPPPPQEFYSLSGTVKGIYGATINLEIDDPDDYLPHPDGSPRRKQVRFANISSQTKYTLIDFSRLDKNGNPARSSLKLNDIKVGDVITVRSNENIRAAEKFDVTEVELFKY
jgi:hypothetical protein